MAQTPWRSSPPPPPFLPSLLSLSLTIILQLWKHVDFIACFQYGGFPWDQGVNEPPTLEECRGLPLNFLLVLEHTESVDIFKLPHMFFAINLKQRNTYSNVNIIVCSCECTCMYVHVFYRDNTKCNTTCKCTCTVTVLHIMIGITLSICLFFKY